MNKRAYWIHGKRGSGKTELAKLLAPDALALSGISAEQAIHHMKDANSIIFEEFSEKRDIKESGKGTTILDVVICALRGQAYDFHNKQGRIEKRKRFEIDIDTIIIVAQCPPSDEIIKTLFRVIEITDVNRRPHEGFAKLYPTASLSR